VIVRLEETLARRAPENGELYLGCRGTLLYARDGRSRKTPGDVISLRALIFALLLIFLKNLNPDFFSRKRDLQHALNLKPATR
jgi:hypothetical protein